MSRSLKQYINEARGGGKLTDQEEIVYKDGTVVKMSEVEEKFRTSTFYIFNNFGYFAPALKALTPIWTNEIDTMATDGIRLFMNPKFTAKLSDQQCIFVLLHECMHNILNHMTREKAAGHSDHRRANIAADYECNGILEDEGLVKKGTTKSLDGYIDPKYSGWAYERIYADADMKTGGGDPSDMGQPQGGSGSGDGSSGSGQLPSQEHGPDWTAGWNQAMKDYRDGKLKI